MLLACSRQAIPDIPRNSAGQFQVDVPITDKPQQPLRIARGSLFPILRCSMSDIAPGKLVAAGGGDAVNKMIAAGF